MLVSWTGSRGVGGDESGEGANCSFHAVWSSTQDELGLILIQINTSVKPTLDQPRHHPSPSPVSPRQSDSTGSTCNSDSTCSVRHGPTEWSNYTDNLTPFVIMTVAGLLQIDCESNVASLNVNYNVSCFVPDSVQLESTVERES